MPGAYMFSVWRGVSKIGNTCNADGIYLFIYFIHIMKWYTNVLLNIT